MTRRRITVDRISLQLEGLPVAQAELLATQLQAALATASFPVSAPSPSGGGLEWGHTREDPSPSTDVPPSQPSPGGGRSEDTLLETDLVGPELVRAVAARLMDLIGAAAEARRSSQEM